MTSLPRPTTLVVSNIAWDFVWQRHQSMASLFARDTDVVFCELPGVRRVGIRDVARVMARLRAFLSPAATTQSPRPPGLRIVRPFVLPATNPLFCAFNARRIRRLLRAEPVLRGGVELIINYSPSATARDLIAAVPHQRLIYDCTDDWLAVKGIPARLPADERALLAAADLTLVPSRTLEARKRPEARRIVRVPHGAFVERFLVPPRVRRPDAPFTLLYYGHLHRQHLDFAAIEMLAMARPAWRVVLVGPVKTPHAFPSNVALAGQQPHERLRDYVAEADVLILPYALNDYTRAVLPAKTYECLATGRPIVATPLPELVAEFSAHIKFAAAPGEWVGTIETVVVEEDAGRSAARIALAQANTWSRRYDEVRGLLLDLENRNPTGGGALA